MAVLAGAAHADPKQASEVRAATGFRAIDLAGTLQVEVRTGPLRVEVTGDADRIAQVTTDVKGGTLVIGTKGKLRGVKQLKVIVSAPALDALTISGTGELVASGLAGAKLAVNIPGTGQMKLGGKVGSVAFAMDGTGSVEAQDLIAASAAIDIAGTGQAVVHATSAVDATISGTGAVKVLGNPASVKKSITGVGAIQLR